MADITERCPCHPEPCSYRKTSLSSWALLCVPSAAAHTTSTNKAFAWLSKLGVVCNSINFFLLFLLILFQLNMCHSSSRFCTLIYDAGLKEFSVVGHIGWISLGKIYWKSLWKSITIKLFYLITCSDRIRLLGHWVTSIPSPQAEVLFVLNNALMS